VERRIGVMTDPKKEHLSVQFVHTADRAFRNVGRKREWIGSDPGGLRSGRRESVEVIASQYTGQSPERIRNDSEARRRWRSQGVEGFVVVLDQDGITTVPLGPRASRRASIRPSGPPSTGRVARKDVCTSKTPSFLTPSVRS
jgi:hypothetical protein